MTDTTFSYLSCNWDNFAALPIIHHGFTPR
jgi:hypothetical protein